MHWKLLLIFAAIGLSVWSILGYGIRKGKDLSGGLSLVYQVNISPDISSAEAEEILTNTIEVLKNRINPQGVFDISIVPQGRDRIEIVMPLPSPEVTAAKNELDDILNEIHSTARIDPAELDQALQQGSAVERWGGDGDTPQRDRMETLQEAYDQQIEALRQFEEAQGAGADATELGRLEGVLAEAIIKYDDLREDVLRYSLTEQDLLRTLRLPTEPRTSKNEQTGEVTEQPSQREVELESLSGRFPHLAGDFDRMVEAFGKYNSLRKGFDDPEDLKRLLRGAGVLEFRIAVSSGAQGQGFNANTLREDLLRRGPDERTSPFVRWMKINDLKQWYKEDADLLALQRDPVAYFAARKLEAGTFGSDYYLLIYDIESKKLTHEGGMPEWSLTSAFRTQDTLGRPAVGFELDQQGGLAMRRLTGPHVQQPMAIVLDSEVYSAPNLNSAIGGRGVVEGSFSELELSYLIRVLAAGSLEARLSPEPIAQNEIGPSIGFDNLRRGLWACVWGFIVTATFMLIYYFVAGVVADIALLVNAVLIFGIMAMQQASFTLPGIVGVVLSIAMAVDANVLIYERIREEVNAGNDLKEAIRLGYSRALRAIIDGNVAHLIVVLVLYQTATTEVKGFALTTAIGVLTTLFTALFVTRVIYAFYTDVFKFKKLPMLPTVFPAIQRFLTPNINWMGLRKVFLPLSGLAMIASIALVVSLGPEILDTEFRGGISATIQTRMAVDAERAEEARISEQGRIMLERGAVEDRIHQIGEANATDPLLSNFANASVLAAGRGQEGSWADTFQIKVTADTENVADQNRLVDAIVGEFEDSLETSRPFDFDQQDVDQPRNSIFDVSQPFLGQNIGRTGFDIRVDEYQGGVAIVVTGIEPPADLDDVTTRIERMRLQETYRAAADRTFTVYGLDPDESGEGYESLVVLAHDPEYEYVDDPDLWQSQLADNEWTLVREALTTTARLEQVSSFSSSIAQTLAAGATTAVVLSLMGILVYIWIRFGSLRYSLGTIIALTHDVVIALGFLALTHFIAGSPVATALGIEKFHLDLNVVAALLTIIGYSLNDTIVIMDRIRENRGKVAIATPEQVNHSINLTLSRTMLTGGSAIVAVFIMYLGGGTGIRPLAYVLFLGLIIGTYGSIAIAAQVVVRWGRDRGDSAVERGELAERSSDEQPEPAVG